MPEADVNSVSIELREKLSIVALKVSNRSVGGACERLSLAPALRVTASEPICLWLAPDHYLFVSNSISAESILKSCRESLADFLHNAVDQSAGLMALRISGPGASHLLASGCGLDFRTDKFPIGTCCRTRLAQIAVIIAAERSEQFDVYVERSYGAYLHEWLTDSLSIAECAVAYGG